MDELLNRYASDALPALRAEFSELLSEMVKRQFMDLDLTVDPLEAATRNG